MVSDRFAISGVAAFRQVEAVVKGGIATTGSVRPTNVFQVQASFFWGCDIGDSRGD